MATGTSLMLIAIGAVLAIAVNLNVQGLDINAVGVIFMVVGIVGLLWSSLCLASYAPFGNHDSHHTHYDYDHDLPRQPHTHERF